MAGSGGGREAPAIAGEGVGPDPLVEGDREARGEGGTGGGRDLVLVVLVVGGLVLRFWRLGAQSLWYDEWLTTKTIGGGFADLLRHIADQEGHPPAYFLLMWGWVRLFGDGEAALRAVSALAGAATIPVVYAAAHELGRSRRAARVAALLVAVNPMLVWYSQEARPYSLLALVGAASLLAFARLWRRGGRRDWMAWSVTCAVTVAVHYFGAFLVLAEAAALVVARGVRGVRAGRSSHEGSERSERPWRQVGLALVPSGVVLAVLAPLALRQHSHEANRLWISAFPLPDRLADAGRSALVGPSPPSGRLWPVAALVVVLAGVLLVVGADARHRNTGLLLAAVGGVAVALPLGATVVGLDVVLARFLIAALVPLLVAVALGLTAPPAERGRGRGRAVTLIGTAGIGVLCVVSLVAVVEVARDPELQRAEWRHVADVVDRHDGPAVLVVNVHGGMAQPLRHYVDGSRALGDGDAVRVTEVDVLVALPTERPCNLLVGRGCGMVFLGAPPPDPLAHRLRLVDHVRLDQFRIDRYRADATVRVTTDDLVAPVDRPDALALVLPPTGP